MGSNEEKKFKDKKREKRKKRRKFKQRSINAQCADVLNSFTIQVASLARRSG